MLRGRRSRPGRKVARSTARRRGRSRDYFGGFNVVLFAPEDLRLPAGRAGGAAALPRPRGVQRCTRRISARCRPTRRCCSSRNAVLRDGGGPRASATTARGLRRAAGARGGARSSTRRRALVERARRRACARRSSASRSTGLAASVSRTRRDRRASTRSRSSMRASWSPIARTRSRARQSTASGRTPTTSRSCSTGSGRRATRRRASCAPSCWR